MRVTALNIHPVKSTAIRPVARARVHRWGLAGDRRWMVLDRGSRMLTARQEVRLFRITADTPETGADVSLRLSTPGREPIDVEVPTGPSLPVEIFSDVQEAVDAGDAPAQWLSDALDRSVRLVHCADPSRRQIDLDYARPGDQAAFADGYPLLLTGEASLAQVNAWVAQGAAERGEPAPDPLPMSRFRPNVVVDHPDAFAEDAWTRIRIGQVPFRVVKGCGRCVMTGVDPDTLERGREPLATLGRYRRVGSRLVFGQNLVPDGEGDVCIGDEVQILD